MVDRRTHSGNGNGNGVVRFLRNGRSLAEAEPVPIGFAEEAVFVVCFARKGATVLFLSLALISQI